MLGDILLGSYLLASVGVEPSSPLPPPAAGVPIGLGPLGITYAGSLEQNVSQSLSLGQTVTQEKSLGRSASNTLSLTQVVAVEKFIVRRTFANLNLTQTVVKQIDVERSVSNTLVPTQVLKRVFERSVANSVAFVQTVAAVNSKNVQQTLTLTQTVGLQKVLGRAVSNTIPIADIVRLNRTVNLRASNPLALSQIDRMTKVIPRAVTQSVTLTQEVVRLKIFAAASSLASLSQSVSVQRVLNRLVANTLVPAQAVLRNVTYNFNLSSTLVFPKERIRRIRIGGLTEVTFPHISGRAVRGITADCGEVNYRTIVLQAGGRNVILPRPEFGDREAGTSTFVLSHSMTGVKRTTVKRSDTEVLNWSFDVRYDKFKELVDFLFTANTEAFLIDDHKGRLWVGKLLSNPITFADVREPIRCQSKVTFALDFEALRLS